MGSSSAWIVAPRTEHGYLYIGCADASQRASVWPHPKGLKLVYDAVYGGVTKPRRQYPREAVIPGEFSLTKVVRYLRFMTGVNSDHENNWKNIAQREGRLRRWLRESGLWERRGRLGWPVPRGFFAALSPHQFRRGRTVRSYRAWWATYIASHAHENAPFILRMIKEERIPMPHAITGFTQYHNRLAQSARWLDNPQEWEDLITLLGLRVAAHIFLTQPTFDFDVLRALDPAYFEDLRAIDYIHDLGASTFVRVPYAETRIAMALRHLWLHRNDPVIHERTLAAPQPPSGYRWMSPADCRRRFDYRKIAEGHLRYLLSDHEEPADRRRPFSTRQIFTFEYDAERGWINRDADNIEDLPPRERIQLVGLLHEFPNGPLPAITERLEEHAQRVAARHANRPWIHDVLSPTTEPSDKPRYARLDFPYRKTWERTQWEACGE